MLKGIFFTYRKFWKAKNWNTRVHWSYLVVDITRSLEEKSKKYLRPLKIFVTYLEAQIDTNIGLMDFKQKMIKSGN